MICRLIGRLEAVRADAVEVAVGGVCYEVLIPGGARAELEPRVGQEVTLFTLEYLDGNPTVGNMVPRMVGFVSPSDRAFFHAFVRVKGVGIRKALRAMAIPAAQIAAAIEGGDERALSALPEIGKRTAGQIIAQLRERMAEFAVSVEPVSAPTELTAAQQVALEILVQWGDRRADAERYVAAAVEADPSLTEPEDIVRAAYRMKHAGV